MLRALLTANAVFLASCALAFTPDRELQMDSIAPSTTDHEHFSSILAQAQLHLVGGGTTIDQVQQPSKDPVVKPELLDETPLVELPTSLDNLPLKDLERGVAKLKAVSAEVSTSDAIPTQVKTQLLWNLNRMVTDSQRLRNPALAPLARRSLLDALRLRFKVLQTPSFWQQAVDKSLLLDAKV